ncbi:hypothetical protein D3C83_321480 [compost metagenome]
MPVLVTKHEDVPADDDAVEQIVGNLLAPGGAIPGVLQELFRHIGGPCGWGVPLFI